MQEVELYQTLRDREEILMRELQSITAQLKVCREMRATLAPALGIELPPLPVVPAVAVSAGAAASSATVPSPPTASASPAEAQPARKPIFEPTAEELAEITALADSSRRGRLVAKVELAIAQCGETFSLRDVLRVFHTKFGGHDHYSDNARVGGALWKAIQKRGYRLIRQGAGRTPSVYSKY